MVQERKRASDMNYEDPVLVNKQLTDTQYDQVCQPTRSISRINQPTINPSIHPSINQSILPSINPTLALRLFISLYASVSHLAYVRLLDGCQDSLAV
jgi:hypothetical protein